MYMYGMDSDQIYSYSYSVSDLLKYSDILNLKTRSQPNYHVNAWITH